MAYMGVEQFGFCGPCRVLFTWFGKLQSSKAACPDCGAPLQFKKAAQGQRYAIEARTPVERSKAAS